MFAKSKGLTVFTIGTRTYAMDLSLLKTRGANANRFVQV
jgi:hypothetical protein